MIFGLIGVLIVCMFPAYSGKVLGLGNAIKGYLPIVPLFLIVLLSFVWNAVAGRFNRRLALSAGGAGGCFRSDDDGFLAS